MTRDDALFNWLQMKYVAEQRPDDQAAQDTHQFFTDILTEDFKLQDLTVETNDVMYIVRFVQEGKPTEKTFPIEFVRQLLHDIESEPKYN